MDHKKYMAKIGAKGGAAGRGDPKRAALNKRAAQIRWAAYRKAKRKHGRNNSDSD